MIELWRAVPEWEGFYEVSNLGRVRTIARTYERSRYGKRFPISVRAKIRKTPKGSLGYPVVNLHRDNKPDLIYVHHLVLLAFHGPPAKEEEANHKDGIKHNNHVGNLEWVTSSENKKHAYRIGLR